VVGYDGGQNVSDEERRLNPKSGWKPWKPALGSKSESEEASGPWRPTKWQVLWAIGMVVALLTTALLIVNLRPEIWKGLLEERNLTFIAIGVSLAAIIVLLALGGASLGWTGFSDKKLWDWLQLLSALAIPIVLAAAGFWFTMQQDARQQLIENQRAKAERELAMRRAQDEALQAYFDQMNTLLLEKNLRESEEDSEVRTLARARTLTVLGRMDPSRKEAVIQFLDEANLVHRVEGRGPIIMLGSADLRGAVLSDPDINDPNLAANLSGAHLVDAKLSDVELGFASLGNANFRYAALRDANLHYTDLRNADLGYANLRDANLRQADLGDATLYLADLRYANLSGADLTGVNLRYANLSGANLAGVNLRDANLSGANLVDVRGITVEQLEEQPKILEGATRPNSQR
jgi:uncharacterized protein YjbI with pentapeptide repeats